MKKKMFYNIGSRFHGTTRHIGQAFNPTLAMINHSCDPNSVHFNIGKATISVATRLIKKGEEVLKSDILVPFALCGTQAL
jgi:hypothetical protein